MRRHNVARAARLGAWLAACVSGVAMAQPADTDAVARGELYAARNCAGCHCISPKGVSPYRAAPPFRQMPPVNAYALQGRLQVLLGKDHYGMPQRFLTVAEASDLAAFIESVRNPAPKDRRLRAAPCIATAC